MDKMKTQLIDSNDGSPVAYNSLLLPPKSLSIFGSDLCLKIISELVKKPACAMDLARSLEEHEQKIYYHLRRLESAGIIRQLRLEKRYGMTAKIYSLVSPVVATKLYDDGEPLASQVPLVSSEISKILNPFIIGGKFNAIVVLGDSYSHGRFDEAATEAPQTFDLALILGRFINTPNFPNYKLDTEINDEDLKKNLILIGNPKTNIIIDRINNMLPVYFDEKNDFAVVSKKSKTVYTDTRIGVILKVKNPFDENKRILILGGKTRQRGTKAAIVAFLKHANKLIAENDDEIIKVVKGLDLDGDRRIDDAKILE